MGSVLTRFGFAGVALTVALVALCLVPVVAAAEETVSPPHIATERDTDVCAMCHRAHTAAGMVEWSAPTDSDTRHSALIVGTASNDSDLCFTCHGIESLGSGTDVQSSIEATSGHSLGATDTAYGPVPTACGSCHDTHGAARDATGSTYPGLLRTATSDGALVYAGVEVCTSCHLSRPANEFPGLSVWKQSPHSKIATPTSGTSVICVACHDPHGSDSAPAIVSVVDTPAAGATPVEVAANDRTLCQACHPTSSGVWPGASGYTGSSHASSTATVTVTGEWVKTPLDRAVGECQNCHAPMGRADASGTVIPSMLDAEGRALCDRCHDADGPAKTNMASLAYSPATPGREIVAAYSAITAPEYGRVQLYSRESTSPGAPTGPREVDPVTAVGAMAAADVDGDGVNEAVVADLSAARVALVEHDALRAAKTTLLSLPNGEVASLLAVGDVIVDGTGLPEIISVSETGAVEVSRLAGGALQSVATTELTSTPTAVTTGDLLGGPDSEIVITTQDDDALLILQVSSGSIQVLGSYATAADPVGVAAGDLDGEAVKEEAAVISAGGGADNAVALYNGDGTRYAEGSLGGVPAAVLIGDVLPGYQAAGSSGAEIAVAYGSPATAGGVRVIEQPTGGGLGAHTDYDIGPRTNPTSLAFGDADGDGDADLVIGLAGSFTRDANAVAPGVQVFSPDGAGLGLAAAFSRLNAGGTELAATRASVAVVDLGAVGPSRHPVGATPRTHDSTEGVPAARHVECADCHNAHKARGDSADTPVLPGELLGAWGVSATNVDASTVSLTGRSEAASDHEVCFSCHSKWDPAAPRWIASEVNTRGASFHPVEGPSRETSATGSTLTTAAAEGGTIRCTSCHGTSAASGPAGPHRSPTPPLLAKRMAGALAGDSDLLCYTCHKREVYFTGTEDNVSGTRSGFFNDAGATENQRKLHSFHSVTGVTCAACHESHGSNTVKHLIRGDQSNGDPFDYEWSATGGQCTSECHSDPDTPKSYTR